MYSSQDFLIINNFTALFRPFVLKHNAIKYAHHFLWLGDSKRRGCTGNEHRELSTLLLLCFSAVSSLATFLQMALHDNTMALEKRYVVLKVSSVECIRTASLRAHNCAINHIVRVQKNVCSQDGAHEWILNVYITLHEVSPHKFTCSIYWLHAAYSPSINN